MIQYLYSSIRRLREEGVTPKQAGDGKLLELIQGSSETINLLTAQFFSPVEAPVRCAGGYSILHHPKLVPILKVNGIYELENGSRYLVSSSDYDFIPGERTIRSLNGTFSSRVEIDGVFGWLREGSAKDVETTTAEDIESSATGVLLASVDGIEPRDVAIIGEGNDALKVIVEDVDQSTSRIGFDNVGAVTTISSGASVRVYGAVPLGIERACKLFVIRNLPALGSDEFYETQIQGRIKSEKTDNYSYTLQGSGESGGSSGQLTGSPEIDGVLSHFTPPPYVGAA